MILNNYILILNLLLKLNIYLIIKPEDFCIISPWNSHAQNPTTSKQIMFHFRQVLNYSR